MSQCDFTCFLKDAFAEVRRENERLRALAHDSGEDKDTD